MLGQLDGLAQEVGLEQDAVKRDAEPRERLSLPGDHPCARAVPQLECLAIALQDALDQLIRGVALHLDLARERVLGLVGRADCDDAGSRDVLGVALADEVIALHVPVRPCVGAVAALQHAGHRLTHRAPEVRYPAATLDVCAGLRERSGKRVADREVAQVPDVQRLRRVRVPELHRDAPPLREIRQRRFRSAAGLERGAGPLDPRVGDAQPHRIALDEHALDPRLAAEPLERGLRSRIVLPLRRARDQDHVIALLRASRRARSPRCGRFTGRAKALDVVKKIGHHQLAGRRSHCHAPAGARTRITDV